MDLESKELMVVAVDFSPASLAAAHYACGLAEALEARVVLVHVVDTSGRVAMADGHLVPERRLDEAQANIEHRLHDLLQELAHPGLDVVCRVERGDPLDVLLRESDGAFMLVLGTAGRSGLGRVLVGSMAESLVRRSHTPVLTVHADGTLARVA